MVPAQDNQRSLPSWILLTLLCMLPAEAAGSPSPFLGKPLPIPGTIEAEFFDLGGEGAAYHFSGNPVTNDIFSYPWTQWRPGEGIASAVIGSTNVVLQTSEWLNYTVECTQTGAYSLQLKTAGPPPYYVYVRDGMFSPIYDLQPTIATLHLELDGQDVSGPMRVQTHMVCPRIWIPEGPHQLRLVLDYAQDARDFDVGYQGIFVENWPRFAIPVDWIRAVRAAPALRQTVVAGGTAGFLDGVGTAARLGASIVLAGEQSSGDLVLSDPDNAAIRLLSPDGELRTLAGHPGNPIRDGTGTNAGFGEILNVLRLPGDAVALVERGDIGSERVRHVSPAGEVTTLYLGRPVVKIPDFSPGHYGEQSVDRPVPLQRLLLTDSGDLRVVGLLEDHRLEIGPGPWQLPDWIPYTRHVWFQFFDGILKAIALDGPPPPSLEPTDLGSGIRRHPGTGALVTEESPGFFQDILPEILPGSVLRAREGILYATRHPATVVRLDPHPTLSSLRVHTTGDGAGRVSGVPDHFIGPEEDIVLTATPEGRFVVFAGWSDGVTDNPRTVRISRDLQLTARFETRLPSPLGILPGTFHIGSDGFPRFALVGDPNPYVYRIERSTNLIHWTTAEALIGNLNGGVSGSTDSLAVSRAEAWVSLILKRHTNREYFRTILLSR